MQFVREDEDFGMMRWRLLSRDPETKMEIYVLPITGVGTYMRTVLDGRHEEPILMKNGVVLEVITRVEEGKLVDAQGQSTSEPKFKCLNREIISLDMAKKRFMPKGKPVAPGLDIVPGALLTQEQRTVVQPAMAPPPEVLKKIEEARQAEAQP